MRHVIPTTARLNHSRQELRKEFLKERLKKKGKEVIEKNIEIVRGERLGKRRRKKERYHSNLYVNYIREISGFLKVIETLHLHELSDDLIGDLVSPFIDYGHVDVVDEDRHLLTSRRSVRRPHPLVNIGLDGTLRVIAA